MSETIVSYKSQVVGSKGDLITERILTLVPPSSKEKKICMLNDYPQLFKLNLAKVIRMFPLPFQD